MNSESHHMLPEDPMQYNNRTQLVEPLLSNPNSTLVRDVDEEIDAIDENAPVTVPEKLPSFWNMLQFADSFDIIVLALGILSAVASGCVLPAFSIIFGQIVDNFQSQNFLDLINRDVWYFFVAAGISFVVNFAQAVCFAVSSERQAKKMKIEYFRTVLRQDIAWFDVSDPSEIASRIEGDVQKIQQGIGDSFGRTISLVTTFIFGFILGFVKDWKLTLAMLCIVPLIVVTLTFVFLSLSKLSTKVQSLQGESGAIVEQAIMSIRSVVSFNGEEKENSLYQSKLRELYQTGILFGRRLSVSLGILFVFMFVFYGIGLWVGAKEIADDLDAHCVQNCHSGGKVLTVFWSVLAGAIAISQVGSTFSVIAEARGAAAKLLSLMAQTPSIDSLCEDGLIPPVGRIDGHLEFRNIQFRYPSRRRSEIFHDFSLAIEPGTRVALVGSSGSGKSTAVSLLQRLYDVESGNIYIDGIDIRDYNVKWLRKQIGIVSQEPTLFDCSIADNISFGLSEGSSPSMDEIISAAKESGAHDFIIGFPDGYNTQVGDRGVQLSGGQKQRIAIARAIIRNPKILLLDEATSALDYENERLIYDTFEEMHRKAPRTTLIVAHRLSTVLNADLIVVLDCGNIVEYGTHSQLMALEQGRYRGLFNAHTLPQRNNNIASKNNPIFNRANHPDDLKVEVPSEESPLITVEQSQARKTVPGSLELIKPEWKEILYAVISSAVCGCVFPIAGLFLSNMIVIFYNPDSSYIRRKAFFWSMLFVGIGVIIGIFTYIRIFAFTLIGEKLAKRLRGNTFRKVLSQEIGWFDQRENTAGAISSRLSGDIETIKKANGQNLGRLAQNVSTLVCALVIAFVQGSARLSAIICIIFPFVAFGFSLQMRVLQNSSRKSQLELNSVGSLVSQAVNNIKTVVSFQLQRMMVKLIEGRLHSPMLEGFKRGAMIGFSLGFAQAVMFGSYGFVFWYGGKLIHQGEITFNELMKSLMVLLLAAQGLGESVSMMGDQAGSNAAVQRLFEILNRSEKIYSPVDGVNRLGEQAGSEILLDQVSFCYPSRPEIKVLRNINLRIPSGSVTALVGRSGSGKSTIINILERFYDPDEGHVLLDGVDLRHIDLKYLRDSIAHVGQEPVLMPRSILDNIKYGRSNATLDEVIEAAKLANAHEFIMSLPEKYHTNVGTLGSKLSGGQKQRIAIARAMLKKDAKIVLLDEATSALDRKSESLVQGALDQLMSRQGRRTCIVIAHRLSTLRNADHIVVMDNGVIVEQGSHNSLTQEGANGLYANLVKDQFRG